MDKKLIIYKIASIINSLESLEKFIESYKEEKSAINTVLTKLHTSYLNNNKKEIAEIIEELNK